MVLLNIREVHMFAFKTVRAHNGAWTEFLNKTGAEVHLPLKSMQVRNGEFLSLGGLLHCPPYLAAIFA